MRQAFAEDEAGTIDAEVVLVLRIEQRIAPVVVAEVLIRRPRIVGLGCIIGAAVVTGAFAGLGRVRRLNCAAAREIQIDMRLEVDGEAHVRARRKHKRAAALGRYRLNGLIDCRRINSFAVAGSAEVAHVVARLSGVRFSLR